MKQSDQINELATALSIAQGTLAHAIKDSENPFFKSSYADLASCWEACRGPLSNNKLSVVQAPELTNGEIIMVSVTTRMMHASGQWLETSVSTPVRDRVDDKGKAHKVDAQTIGSAITYLRRYSLCAMVGISPDDDDGNQAAGKAPGNGHAKAKGQPFTPGSWRAYIVPFGKNKGVPLGSLEGPALMWYVNKYEPKPFNGKISDSDQAFRTALDQAKSDLAKPPERGPEMSQAEKDAVMDREIRDAEPADTQD